MRHECTPFIQQCLSGCSDESGCCAEEEDSAQQPVLRVRWLTDTTGAL